MPLKIISATRAGGAGCKHYNLRVTDTGYDQTIAVHLDELDDLIEKLHPDPVKRRGMLAVLWALYKVKIDGAAPASLLNVSIT